jgi:hypothetical protein
MYIFNSNQIDLLDALSAEYQLVLVIDETNTLKPEIYHVSEYRDSTANNLFFSINGYKRITNIVEANSVYVNNTNALRTIVTQIDNLPINNRERKFSNHFKWIKL